MEEANRKLIHNWLGILLNEATINKIPPNESVLMKCADAHYRIANMEKTLEPMKGDLSKLIEFLHIELGWIVHHDKHDKTIIADENKPDCVCPPLYKEGIIDNELLCDCSRGFARQMFSFVLGHDVEAEVVRSVIRRGKSCIYKITY